MSWKKLEQHSSRNGQNAPSPIRGVRKVMVVVVVVVVVVADAVVVVIVVAVVVVV